MPETHQHACTPGPGAKYIEVAWDDFRRSLLTENVTAEQLSASRLTFFAGAYSVMAVLKTNMNTPAGEMPTTEELAVIEAIEDELQAFIQRAKRGEM